MYKAVIQFLNCRRCEMDPEFEYLASKAHAALSFLQEPGNEHAWRELRETTQMDADELLEWVFKDPKSFLDLEPISRTASLGVETSNEIQRQTTGATDKPFDPSLLPVLELLPYRHGFSPEALEKIPCELRYLRAVANRALFCNLRDFAYAMAAWWAFEYVISSSGGLAAEIFVVGQGVFSLAVLFGIYSLAMHFWFRQKALSSFKSAPKNLEGQVDWGWNKLDDGIFPLTW